MAETIEAVVRETNAKIVTDRGFKLAMEPKVMLPTEEGAVEGVIEGKSDLAYTVAMEIVPPITLADFKTIKLDAAHRRSDRRGGRRGAAGDRRPEPALRAKAEGAANGDRVTISFQGTMDGKPFEGGTGEDVP